MKRFLLILLILSSLMTSGLSEEFPWAMDEATPLRSSEKNKKVVQDGSSETTEDLEVMPAATAPVLSDMTSDTINGVVPDDSSLTENMNAGQAETSPVLSDVASDTINGVVPDDSSLTENVKAGQTGTSPVLSDMDSEATRLYSLTGTGNVAEENGSLQQPQASDVVFSDVSQTADTGADGSLFTTDESQFSSQTYRIQLFDSPQTIRVPKMTTSYWFMLSEGTRVESAVLTLAIQSSESLIEKYSTATVEVNNVAISTVDLSELRNSQNSAWAVNIPVSRLKTGGSLNQLSIITTQRSIPGESADIDNPANWLMIGDESALFLTLRHDDHVLLNNLYPFLFNRAELGNEISTELVMAGHDNQAEGAAVLTVASAIGANNPYKNIETFWVSNNKSGITKSFFVFDGKATDQNALDPGEGYLAIRDDNGWTVEVSGGDQAGLKKAVDVLSDVTLLEQFSTDSAVIHSTVTSHNKTFDVHEDGIYTLEDFGYEDVNLPGASHHQVRYTIRQPFGIRGGEGSYFKVQFHHAEALIGDLSMLTVYFNNIPASSIQLSRTNVNDGTLQIPIPREVLEMSNFEILVDVNNYVGKVDSLKDWDEVAWTVIDKESVVYLEPGNSMISSSLTNFLSLWGEDTVVCLPEDTSVTVWQAMAVLSARNGQAQQSVTDYRIVNSIEEKDVKESHIIIAGARNQLNLPSEIAKTLYAQPEKDGYRIDPSVSVMPEALEDKIIIQTVRSPYNFKKNVILIIWPDTPHERMLTSLVMDKNQLMSLSGEVALIGLNSALSLDVAKAKEEKVPLSLEVLLSRLVLTTGISRSGMLVIAILTIIIVILIVHQVRMKNRFADAKKKMEQRNNNTPE